MVDVVEDRCDQLLDAAKHSAPQAIFGQVAEELFYHVQPRATGGREVHVKTGMAPEPALHLGMLVGRVIVHDHVNLLFRRDNVVDDAQEFPPLLMAMPVVAHGDNFALQRIEGGEQHRGAVALVVVGHGAAAALLHRQSWLGAVQSLNLALLIGAQNDGVLGRIQIKANDVFRLLDKRRVVAELEGSHAMRFQSVGAPDATHTGLADAGCPRHGARGPMRGVGRLLMKRHLHHFLHPPVGDGARLARPRRILLQGRDAASQKAAPPTRRLFRRHPHTPSDLPVLQPLGSKQYDPRSFYHASVQRSRQPAEASFWAKNANPFHSNNKIGNFPRVRSPFVLLARDSARRHKDLFHLHVGEFSYIKITFMYKCRSNYPHYFSNYARATMKVSASAKNAESDRTSAQFGVFMAVPVDCKGHTWSEIWQQPDLWRNTAEGVRRQMKSLQSSLRLKESRVLLTGAGTSAYAAASVAAGWPRALAVPSTDLLLDTRRYINGIDVVISLARSGDSPESLAVVERIHRICPEIAQLAITCNASGALATSPLVQSILLDPRTNDRSLVMTSSFSNLVLAGNCLVDPEAAMCAAENACTNALGNLGRIDRRMESLALRVRERILVLASAPLFGWAQEACLKTTEMTAGRFPSLAETYLGLRHGPMSFVSSDTLVLCLLSSDPLRRRYEIDLLHELRGKKLGHLVGITGDPGDDEVFDAVVPAMLPDGPDAFRTPFEVVVPQLLGYHLSRAVGLNPDDPSPDGVIHRVVQGVHIYDSASDLPHPNGGS